MAPGKSAAVVIGSFPLGESDRVVTFFSREHGKLRGVARASRRPRSRFAGALELFTVGELVFFDNGRSELVQIDHFDVVHPLARLREDLDRIGHASWILECIGRLTAERDPHIGLYALLTRSLRSMERGAAGRVAICFIARCLDAVGHRPRLDACVECGRTGPFPRARLGEGGLVCEPCAPGLPGLVAISPAAVSALDALRRVAWEDALAAPLGRTEGELKTVLEAYVTRLIGHAPRATKFLREVRRVARPAGDRG
ncbi:MAG: DNA repair protein RecO [Candidatus Rokubacteria bacterium]|nr:DNA repair protein RecO [Candidatus Rokubacteria bacterium]